MALAAGKLGGALSDSRAGLLGGLLRALSGSRPQQQQQRERHRRAASSSFGGGWASDAFDVSGLEESELDVGVSTAAEEPVLASRRCSRPRAAGRSFDSSARRHACGGGSIRREGWRGRQESTAGDTEESSWPGGPATTGSCRAAALHSPFADHSRYRLAALRSSSLASSTGAEPAKGEGLQRSLLEQRSPTTETEGYDRAADTETGPVEAVEVSASEQEGMAAAQHACAAAAVDAAEPVASVRRGWLPRPMLWAGVKRGIRRQSRQCMNRMLIPLCIICSKWGVFSCVY